MSQRTVEQVIGRLVTDEGFRRRFFADPAAALAELGRTGFELNECERRALECIDARAAARFAGGIDMRIQKSDLRVGDER
jgi:putative modified peptide